MVPAGTAVNVTEPFRERETGFGIGWICPGVGEAVTVATGVAVGGDVTVSVAEVVGVWVAVRVRDKVTVNVTERVAVSVGV